MFHSCNGPQSTGPPSPSSQAPPACLANTRTHIGTEKLRQEVLPLLSSRGRKPGGLGGRGSGQGGAGLEKLHHLISAPHEITSFNPPNNSTT